MAKAPTVKLNSGFEFPVLGLGTWKSKPGEVTQAVKDAIDAGYRHIDCAHYYQNEAEVGAAIKEKIQSGVVKREDLFITSKLWSTFLKPDLVEPNLRLILSHLGLDYLDLFLIHWPCALKKRGEKIPSKAENCMREFEHLEKCPKNNIIESEGGALLPKRPDHDILSEFSNVDYVDTWKEMERLQKLGLTKSIGVSNFNKRQIERIIENGTIVPATNQVECHPYLNQKKLTAFCKSKGIVITAYSPLGSPDRPWAKPGDPILTEEPKIKALAAKYKKTSAQIILRYLLQLGVVVIPKSVNKSRIIQNIDVFDFQLSAEDVALMDTFNCNGRVCQFVEAEGHPHHPFNNDEY